MQTLRRYLIHQRGNVAIIFGLALPAIMLTVAGTIDCTAWLTTKARMQSAADSAALAGAKQFRLANADPVYIASSTKAQVLASLGPDGPGATIQSSVTNGNSVSVQIDLTFPSLFGGLAPTQFSRLHVEAAALTSSTPTCLIALNPNGKGVSVANAAIISNGCSTYSDSQKNDGLHVKQGAISATRTCSAGGFKNEQGDVVPAPILDCPLMTDPLAARPPLAVGNCTYNKTVIAGGSVTLFPGTYCDGINITKGGTAYFTSGVYILSKGKFQVDKDSTIKGIEVGFFLADNAEVNFDFLSTISLTAPKDGPLAGILFFEDRLTKGKSHIFASRNMPMLLGILYLPNSSLVVGAKPRAPMKLRRRRILQLVRR